MIIAALVFVAALGWASCIGWIIIARRWQKIALSNAAFLERYQAMLAKSITLTDVALAERDELAMRISPSESDTADPNYPMH